MQIVIELTESEIKKLAEITDVDIDVNTHGFYDDDVSYAISVLIENS